MHIKGNMATLVLKALGTVRQNNSHFPLKFPLYCQDSISLGGWKRRPSSLSPFLIVLRAGPVLSIPSSTFHQELATLGLLWGFWLRGLWFKAMKTFCIIMAILNVQCCLPVAPLSKSSCMLLIFTFL